MNKLESILDMIKSNECKMNELLHKKDEKKKKSHVALWIFAGIGVVVAVGIAAYFIYRYVKRDYLDDFEDDFEDYDEEDEFEEDGQE